MHCDDAPCIKASPNGSVYKRKDGIVLIDPGKSRGNKDIVTSCPYGMIRWNEELKVPQKCTLCAHLLDENWGKTRCVQSCPTGALNLKALEEEEMKKLIDTEKLEVYRPDLKTEPSVFYKNLYRYTKVFIGGSVATNIGGKEECVEGVKVVLEKGDGQIIGEAFTDTFGDFKFDRLDEGSGLYTIVVSYDSKETKRIQVNLVKSLYVGVIYI